MENNTNFKVVIGLRRSLNTLCKYESLAIKEAGLTIAQFGVLEALYHKGDMNVSQIIEKTLSTSGNMTVVIENLRKAGLIRKYPCPTDKRISIISISKKGSELISTIFPAHSDNIDRALINLDSEEKEQLVYLLKKLSYCNQTQKED